MNDRIKKDCIFFGGLFEDTNMFVCDYSCRLYEGGEDMCKHCRLWDAYIPNNSSEEQKEKAIEWQNKPYGEQEDYDEYFK